MFVAARSTVEVTTLLGADVATGVPSVMAADAQRSQVGRLKRKLGVLGQRLDVVDV